jgi:hypothetical protein
MKAAFVLIMIAMLILPAVLTVRIMVNRERRRLRDEGRR